MQGTLGTQTNAVGQALDGAFGIARNTLTSESGGFNFLSFLGTIIRLGGLFTDFAPISLVFGTYFAVAGSVSGSNGVNGDLASLQTQLASIINQMNSAAQNIYPPICTDWGKLQSFETLVQSLQGDTTIGSGSLQTIANQYEIAIYQSVTPSTMAIVYYAQARWGSCGNGNGSALGYTPSQTGQNGYNGTLCSRLSTLGVSMNDVVNRTGGWSNLDSWECVSTREGTYCHKA